MGLYACFLAATASPYVVSVNLVAREDDRVALQDYDLHMRMLKVCFGRERQWGREGRSVREPRERPARGEHCWEALRWLEAPAGRPGVGGASRTRDARLPQGLAVAPSHPSSHRQNSPPAGLAPKQVLKGRYPAVNLALHAGELTPELVRALARRGGVRFCLGPVRR